MRRNLVILSTYVSEDLWKLEISGEKDITKYISSYTLKFLIKACVILSNKPGEVILSCNKETLSQELNVNSLELTV